MLSHGSNILKIQNCAFIGLSTRAVANGEATLWAECSLVADKPMNYLFIGENK